MKLDTFLKKNIAYSEAIQIIDQMCYAAIYRTLEFKANNFKNNLGQKVIDIHNFQLMELYVELCELLQPVLKKHRDKLEEDLLKHLESVGYTATSYEEVQKESPRLFEE